MQCDSALRALVTDRLAAWQLHAPDAADTLEILDDVARDVVAERLLIVATVARAQRTEEQEAAARRLDLDADLSYGLRETWLHGP